MKGLLDGRKNLVHRFEERPEIHVWHVDLLAEADPMEWYAAVLEDSERERAERSRSDPHRRRFIVTQGALRYVLAQYLENPPSAIRFEQGEHGKPRLAGTPPDYGLVFNVSHSGDHALLAVGRDLALGIDLELRRPVSSVEGIVQRCFAPSEREYWLALPEPERMPAFFDFWTGKEAFVKAVGRGLALGLARCVLATGEPPRLAAVPEPYGSPEDWSLWRLDMGAHASATLCARTPWAAIRRLTFDTLHSEILGRRC